MTALVVPIDLAALCVGKPDVEGQDPGGPASALGPLADFSALPYAAGGQVHNRGPYIGAAALADSAAFEGSVPIAAGIHLHWALPDGLTHGSQRDGRTRFPPVPNRWLLTRIAVDPATGAAALRSWVVESDRLSPAPTAPAGVAQPTVPLAPAPGQSFRYVGQAFDLATWTEAGASAERLSPLTAVGYGEPSFAALYSNSSTVFGMLDPLADLAGVEPGSTRLAYHVAGWYSDPAADPLAAGDVPPLHNRLRWTWTGAGAPTATVCSGLVEGVEWDPARAYLGDAPRPLAASIGPSGAEALSALMASVLDPSRYPDAEQLLDAVQLGVLSRQGEVDSLARFEQALHASAFASSPGGSLWSIAPAAPPPSHGGAPPPEGAPPPPVPAGAGEALDALNARQAELDALGEELRARRERLFADWWKYLIVVYRPQDAPASLQGRAGDVGAQLEAEIAQIAAITDAGGRREALEREIATLAAALRALLPQGLELSAATAAPRLYAPADPVLVLSGADATPPARYGRDGEAGPHGHLPCRLEGEVVAGVALAAGLVPGSAAVALDAAALPALPAALAAGPAALAQALVREAMLLSPALQPAVAAAVAELGGAANPGAIDRAATVAALARAAAAFAGGEAAAGVSYAGAAPDPIGVGAWSGTPWLPILLDWEISFAPFAPLEPAGAYAPDAVDAAFRLDPDAVDLAPAGPLPSAAQRYAGRTVLSPDATVDMVGQIRRYLEGTGDADPELRAIVAELRSMPVLAQRLTGATDALLMRSPTLQMPVADPLAPPFAQGLATAVAAAVAGETALSPLPEEAFNPIRAGVLRVERVRLIDAFGRLKDYDAPPLAVAHALAPPAGAPAGSALLPPRIAQPARLLLRWLAASDGSTEANDDPATTPIAGWLLPIWLDRAIAIHAADGTVLGELAVTPDGSRALWTPAPGGPFPPGTPIDQALAGADPAVRGFALAAYAGGDGSFLAPFLAALREALMLALPPELREDAESAVLAGQPLALARAGVSLELGGPAAPDESWASFAAQVLDGAPPSDGGLTGVRFPVRLGSPSQLGDALVGFWLDAGGATDYGSFWAPAATAARGGVAPPAQDTLALTPQAAPAEPARATLLLDPRGWVHATSGILPVERIRIPAHHYAPALRALVPTLAARPVLSGSAPGAMSLALPKLTSGAWSWIGVSGGAWQEAAASDASAQATLGGTPQRIVEGWLRPSPPDGSEEEGG